MIDKIARIVKKDNKWCVIGHKKDKSGKYRNFGCYDNKEDAKKRLGQIYAFKTKKATILNIMTNASDSIEQKGMIHISDAIIGCAESIAVESSNDNIVIRLGKIVNLLEKKGEIKLSEQLDSLIPDILCFEECGCDNNLKQKNCISADKAYKIAKLLHDKYLVGLIDESSFEYSKKNELEKMLKSGFSLPFPKFCDKAPEGFDNWWEYFSKGE